MNQPTISHFYLGANSRYGFYSLYDQFATAPQDTLHIIKSGPGTGKSTFMKRIGSAAEKQGLDVEYIHCSGDPNSLDGVYIPDLHQGWVDGTAPHILEPRHFGIDGNYINLGKFCSTQKLLANQDLIKNTTAAYRFCYQKAYMYLEAVGSLYDQKTILSANAEYRLKKRAQAKIKRELSDISICASKPVKRFLTAISCIGKHTLTSTIDSMCSRLCVLESSHKLESIFFNELISEANAHNIYYILCMNPLCPDQVDAILFPHIELGFIATHENISFSGKTRTIHLDSYLDNVEKIETRQKEKLTQQLLDAATQQLSHAKQYHDELESYYISALDKQALNEYTESVIKTLFA